MIVWEPMIMLSVLRTNGISYTLEPCISGHWKTEEESRNELIRGAGIILEHLEKDPRYDHTTFREPDGNQCLEIDVFYTDRCITINGWQYRGNIDWI